MEMQKHWTSRSIDAFVFGVSSGFIAQLETKLEIAGQNYKDLANEIGVTQGRVSQVLNNPGNMTLKSAVKYARALGMKVALIAYEDQDDPGNNEGPVNSQVFVQCWKGSGSPRDLFGTAESA